MSVLALVDDVVRRLALPTLIAVGFQFPECLHGLSVRPRRISSSLPNLLIQRTPYCTVIFIHIQPRFAC
jgi:hypothetical protein